MSKKTIVEQNKESKAFEAFALQADEKYDPGLAKFHRDAIQVEQLLRNPNIEVDPEGLLNELNDKWPFHGQEITVSGKLYVFSGVESLDKYALKALGARKLDNWGEYFEVEDTTLISMGLTEARLADNGNNEPYLSYVYALDGEDEEPTFIARLGDIHKAEYPYSTYESCVAHLKHEHPALYGDIVRLITPHVYDMNKLTNTLHYLVQTYPEICSDERLNTWVSVFITNRADFDKKSTYTFLMEGEIMLPDDQGDEIIYSIAEPYKFDAYIMSVQFGIVEGDETTNQSVGFYNLALPGGIKSQSEHLDSSAMLPITSVIEVEPRRPVLSVREQLESAQLDKIRPALARAGLVKLTDFDIPEMHISDSFETEKPITKREQWARLQSQLDEMIVRVKEARTYDYPVAEAAQIMASHLVNEFNALLQEFSEIAHKTLIEVSGPGVGMPLIKFDRIHTDKEDVITVKSDLGGLYTPGITYETTGTFIALSASVQEIDDNTYKPEVFMSLNMGELTRDIAIVSYNEIPLANMIAQQAALINLDGTATIEVSGLKYAMRREEILREFHKECRRKSAVREFNVIRELDRAIHCEIDTTTISLNKISLVHEVDDIMRSSNYVDGIAQALGAIMGGGRMLIVNGEIVDKDGRAILANNYMTYCVDAVHSLPFSDERMPSLVVMPTGVLPGANETPLLYVPLRSITSLQY